MRILDRLEQLYAIGGGAGANRPHPSPAEDEAFELVAGWLREAGLEVETDVYGNLLGHSHVSRAEAAVWTGSHLDSVPEGGKYDGALGVVAAIEAVETVGSGSVAAFRGEEVGCVGSRRWVEAGGVLPSIFLELHVEQGPVLEQAAAPLGIVTSIVGYVRGELVFDGRAGHAGTTPMAGRDDALVEAAEAILRIRDTASAIDGAVATVGQVDVEPAGSNVIPGRVRISVDARAPDSGRLDELVAAIGLESAERTEPVAMSDDVRAAVKREIEQRGLPVVELSSGAGHDAGILAARGVSAGMLFVRSLNGGVSHSPDERTSDEDVELAVEVLTATVRGLATPP